MRRARAHCRGSRVEPDGQRDNLRFGRHDGAAAVVERLKVHPLVARVPVTRSGGAQIAALVTELLVDRPA